MSPKLPRVQGLRRRWLAGSIGPVAAILLLVGALISVGFASNYYNSARSTLRAKAAAGADYFNTYVMIGYKEYYRSATLYAATFDDRDHIELQFLNSSGRVEVTTRGLTAGTYPSTPEVARAVESGTVQDYVGRDEATGERIIAADGGWLACRKTGITPDLLLGDFDSLSTQPDFPNILRVPVEKDDTDTMLAVKTGLERGETEFHIYGGMGGRRTDHTIANFQALLYLARRGAQGWLYGQGERYTAVCGGTVTFPARDRGILSVFCLGADARDVSIQGGQYPLHHAVLTAEFPLGVSNHFVGRPITVSVRDGSLLIGVVED